MVEAGRYLPGAIGYVAWDFTKQNRLTYIAMTNAAGNVVQPGVESFKAAAASADWSGSLSQLLTNQPGKDAWPVMGATYVLLHVSAGKPGQDAATLKFFDWAFKNGAKMAADLDYVPLPDSLVTQIRNTWKTQIKGVPAT